MQAQKDMNWDCQHSYMTGRNSADAAVHITVFPYWERILLLNFWADTADIKSRSVMPKGKIK